MNLNYKTTNLKKVAISARRISKMDKFKKPPKEVILHCSATDNKHFDGDAINKYHISIGWLAIAYHFVIEKKRIVIGRPLDCVGAHCSERNKNFSTIGICLMGEKSFSEIQCNLLTKLLIELGFVKWGDSNSKNSLDVLKRVSPHNKYSPYKSCPNFMVDYYLANNMICEYECYKDIKKKKKK